MHLEWAIPLGIILIAIVLLVPPGNRLSDMQIQQLQSNIQLKGIARLVLTYEKQHGGARPKRVSEIVPDGSNDLLGMFYAPNRPPERRPAAWLTNRACLDESSDYFLLSDSTNQILVFERPSLWLDKTVAVCLTNLDVMRVGVAEFRSLVKHP